MSGMVELSHMPFILLGIAVGLVAFAALMAVLLPVLRGKRRASLSKGFLGILVSFAILSAGVIVVYIGWEGEVILFLLGELLGLFACWTALAVYTMRCGKRS